MRVPVCAARQPVKAIELVIDDWCGGGADETGAGPGRGHHHGGGNMASGVELVMWVRSSCEV